MTDKLAESRFPIWGRYEPQPDITAGVDVPRANQAYGQILAASDEDRLVAISMSRTSHVFFGQAAPANDAGSALVFAEQPMRRILLAGTAVFSRVDSNNVGSCSVEAWNESNVEFNYPV